MSNKASLLIAGAITMHGGAIGVGIGFLAGTSSRYNLWAVGSGAALILFGGFLCMSAMMARSEG